MSEQNNQPEYPNVEAAIDRVQNVIVEALSKDAEALHAKGESCENPMLTARALVETAYGFLAIPIERAIEDAAETEDLELAEEAAKVMVYAEGIKTATLRAHGLASTMKNIPTASVALGLVEAAIELLNSFSPEFEAEITGVEPTEEVPSQDEAEDMLKNFNKAMKDHDAN